ncbi:pyridoxamine 5'-phosphate oxidase [Algibacillus agarilyticus]|uniref:pyridoxamine 5'-phosphate oxidase n=1 Tax=Algibacillus agarilyticus TaxID=2234133 RepID=UPI000DD0676E|nr:pyridoxamine 5'-phosphate oxidase [Algibacillus agarilyticus]
MSIFYSVRREYDLTHLKESVLTDTPFLLFQRWLDELVAVKAVADPTAMIVSTVDGKGMPYQRTVLMKSYDDNGFVFFTNQQSRKGQHIQQNNQVSLIFPWLAMERQVIVTGIAEPISAEENDRYFYSRPLTSQVAAIASAQSQPVASREVLEKNYQDLLAFYEQNPLKRPAHWGGYCVKPVAIEFWQGGENRLHDRFSYEFEANNEPNWSIKRLQP